MSCCDIWMAKPCCKTMITHPIPPAQEFDNHQVVTIFITNH